MFFNSNLKTWPVLFSLWMKICDIIQHHLVLLSNLGNCLLKRIHLMSQKTSINTIFARQEQEVHIYPDWFLRYTHLEASLNIKHFIKTSTKKTHLVLQQLCIKVIGLATSVDLMLVALLYETKAFKKR